MTITTTESQPGEWGQISRHIMWTDEEYKFVEREYPRHGFNKEHFMFEIVEQFHPSGEELLYGWCMLMQLVKDGPDSFGKLEVKPIPPSQG